MTLCVEPTHLFAGTQADNLADMRAKGRWQATPSCGERNGSVVLTDEQVAALRADRPSYSLRALAARYGVSKSQTARIVAGLSRV